MNTLQATTDTISPVIHEGILKPLANAILEGKLTGPTADDLTKQMREVLKLSEPSKHQHVSSGIPSAIRSTVPVTGEAGGFVPEKKGNRYVTDPVKTCEYMWKKGDKANTLCGGKALKDYHLCSNHWRTKTKTTTTASAAAPLGLPSSRPPSSGSTAPTLHLRNHTPEENLYVTDVPGVTGPVLIKYDKETKVGVALQVLTTGDKDGPTRDLTADEKVLASGVGLAVANVAPAAVPSPGIGLAAPTLPGNPVKLPASSGLTLPTMSNGSSGLSLPPAAAPAGLSLPTTAAAPAGLSLPTTTPAAAPAGLSLPTTTPAAAPPTGLSLPTGLSIPTASPANGLPSVNVLTAGGPPGGQDLSRLASLVGGQ